MLRGRIAILIGMLLAMFVPFNGDTLMELTPFTGTLWVAIAVSCTQAAMWIKGSVIVLAFVMALGSPVLGPTIRPLTDGAETRTAELFNDIGR